MSVYVLIFISAVVGLILGMVFALYVFRPRNDGQKFVKADYRNAAPEAEAMPLEREREPLNDSQDVPEQKPEPESRLQREARARRGVSMVDLSSKEDVREHLKTGKKNEERGYNILKKSAR